MMIFGPCGVNASMLACSGPAGFCGRDVSLPIVLMLLCICFSFCWLTCRYTSSAVPFVTSTTTLPAPDLPVLPLRWMERISEGTASIKDHHVCRRDIEPFLPHRCGDQDFEISLPEPPERCNLFLLGQSFLRILGCLPDEPFAPDPVFCEEFDEELHGVPVRCKEDDPAVRVRCSLPADEVERDCGFGVEFLRPCQRAFEKVAETGIFYQALARLAAPRTPSPRRQVLQYSL